MAETYYTVLGVTRAASQAEIKIAYRELMKEVHPDALPKASEYWNKQAGERARDVNEAYAVLSNSQKRRLYDQQLDSYEQSQSRQAPTGKSAAQAHQKQAPSASTQQAQAYGPPSGASQQRPSSAQSTSSGLNKFKWNKFSWALWCVFWGVLWCLTAYPYEVSGETALRFLMTFGSFGLAAWAYRSNIETLLLKSGITSPLDQILIASIVCGILCAIFVGGVASMLKPVRTSSQPSQALPTNPATISTYQQSRSSEPSAMRDGVQSQNGQHIEAAAGSITRLETVRDSFSPARKLVRPDDPPSVTTSQPTQGETSSMPDLSRLSYDDKSGIETQCRSYRAQGPATYRACLEIQLAKVGTGGGSDLSRLSYDDKSGIETQCRSYRAQGPATYHACLEIQLAKVGTGGGSDLSRLSYDDKSGIETQCRSYRAQGPATYHACLEIQLAKVGTSGGSDLSRLSYDDKSSIEIACAIPKTQGPATYHACLKVQLVALGNSIAPDLSRLSYEDKSSTEMACAIPKTRGPASYHICLRYQLDHMSGITPDVSRLSYEDKSSIEMACAIAKTQGPATYHACLKVQLVALGNSIAPDLSRLSYEDKSSTEMACAIPKTRGPASYHICLRYQLDRMNARKH